MDKTDIKRILAVLVASLSAMCVFAQAAENSTKRPNILVIVGDDMGYADVGFHGCKDISTPNLDALAASGARFTNGYVSGPYCSPTREGLMTGRYQTRFGHDAGQGEGAPVAMGRVERHAGPGAPGRRKVG